jgi:hypothetical protein
MTDNFDIKKFLTENKVFWNPNTDVKESSILNENNLREKIRDMVIAELSISEEELEEAKKDKEEEFVEDVEVTDTEEFTPEDNIGTEEPAMDLDGGEKEIMDSLETALEFAKQKGDEKLIDQIGNTITFFTRQYIVK